MRRTGVNRELEGVLQQLTKAVLERALQAEMSHHLGYEKHSPAGECSEFRAEILVLC